VGSAGLTGNLKYKYSYTNLHETMHASSKYINIHGTLNIYIRMASEYIKY
jgi:hypothetical protein